MLSDQPFLVVVPTQSDPSDTFSRLLLLLGFPDDSLSLLLTNTQRLFTDPLGFFWNRANSITDRY